MVVVWSLHSFVVIVAAACCLLTRAASGLQCYRCQGRTNCDVGQKYVIVENCTDADPVCCDDRGTFPRMTDDGREDEIVINLGCEARSQCHTFPFTCGDKFCVGVSCCETDLCNATNGAAVGLSGSGLICLLAAITAVISINV
eukprot:m.33356 g.33356  ORF g.33356 m.33356 type:complete len:143 (+) comp31809_c0_seq1:1973-2401(+)